jgi:hypothetical protein
LDAGIKKISERENCEFFNRPLEYFLDIKNIFIKKSIKKLIKNFQIIFFHNTGNFKALL